MQQYCKEQEVQFIIEETNRFQPNYAPEIVYILIDKNSGIRFLEKYNSNGHIVNPGPGTYVGQGVVKNDSEKTFDFYMVSNNNPSSATAIPVHYDVVFNNSSISKRDIQEFTYHQSYGYFGFGGPIKTPATLKYAERLANYVDKTKMTG